MTNLLKTIVHDYGWVHISLGLIGNICFFVGSVLFLPAFSSWQTFGVWLFIVGSLLMLVGAMGSFLVKMTSPVQS